MMRDRRKGVSWFYNHHMSHGVHESELSSPNAGEKVAHTFHTAKILRIFQAIFCQIGHLNISPHTLQLHRAARDRASAASTARHAVLEAAGAYAGAQEVQHAPCRDLWIEHLVKSWVLT